MSGTKKRFSLTHAVFDPLFEPKPGQNHPLAHGSIMIKGIRHYSIDSEKRKEAQQLALGRPDKYLKKPTP